MRRVLGPASLAGLLLASPPAAAHFPEGAATVVMLSLLPALGPEARFRADSWVETRFVLAFPFQIPLGGPLGPSGRHRLVLAPEFVAFSSAADGGNDDTFLRLRAGYRFVHAGILIAGLGTTFDVESTVSLSPELGVRTPGYASLFAIARLERSLIEDDPLRANLLVGFSIY